MQMGSVCNGEELGSIRNLKVGHVLMLWQCFGNQDPYQLGTLETEFDPTQTYSFEPDVPNYQVVQQDVSQAR